MSTAASYRQYLQDLEEKKVLVEMHRRREGIVCQCVQAEAVTEISTLHISCVPAGCGRPR